jgi:hypothetical protein
MVSHSRVSLPRTWCPGAWPRSEMRREPPRQHLLEQVEHRGSAVELARLILVPTISMSLLSGSSALPTISAKEETQASSVSSPYLVRQATARSERRRSHRASACLRGRTSPSRRRSRPVDLGRDGFRSAWPGSPGLAVISAKLVSHASSASRRTCSRQADRQVQRRRSHRASAA